MVHGPVTVHSTEDMQDLGACGMADSQRSRSFTGKLLRPFPAAVGYQGKAPSPRPFTLHRSIFDIRRYLAELLHCLRIEESTWGIRRSRVYPADKLSVLLILIDRLKRGKTSLQEHFGAYIEVFSGMELHSLPGRARCWLLLMKQCAKDDRLANFVERQLEETD